MFFGFFFFTNLLTCLPCVSFNVEIICPLLKCALTPVQSFLDMNSFNFSLSENFCIFFHSPPFYFNEDIFPPFTSEINMLLISPAFFPPEYYFLGYPLPHLRVLFIYSDCCFMFMVQFKLYFSYVAFTDSLMKIVLSSVLLYIELFSSDFAIDYSNLSNKKNTILYF